MISFSNIINLNIRTKFDFEIESNYISCTIPFEQEVIDQIDNKNVVLNKTEKKVIELLIENPSLKSIELAEKIGVTKRTIERSFKSLQEKKMIERIGSKRDGNWIVFRQAKYISKLKLIVVHCFNILNDFTIEIILVISIFI